MNLLWKKRIKNIGWLALTVAGISLLIAGANKKSDKECRDIKVEVSGVNKHIFLDEKEVEKILTAHGDLVGAPVKAIDLRLLEQRLEKDHWIRNAELFFDNQQVLQVVVEEREPVARIFTIGGNTYYIDSSGTRLPLSEKVSIRVPMFTGFPSEAKRLIRKDSLLMVAVKNLATYIQYDSFWNAQVAQVDITPDRTFEMVPTIGNHIVKLGKGEDMAQKLDRLFSFYKQVWTRIGMERYAVVDVQYKGQVVATRKGTGSAGIDSIKAREAFINLINRNKPDTIDEHEIKASPATVNKVSTAVKTGLTDKVRSAIEKAGAEKKAEVKGNKDVDQTKPKVEAINDHTKPKAVMRQKS